MFCNKCGNKVMPSQKVCNKCGNLLINNIQNEISYKNNKKNITKLSAILAVVMLMLIIVCIMIFRDQDKYYFGNEVPEGNTEKTPTTQEVTNKTKGKYKTAIITDNVYYGISINNIDDANKLIVEDSMKQKQSDYPNEIMQIENRMIQKYSITAVNLKEMNVEFAKELEKVLENIYTNYPGARGYLTNLTLTNLDMSESDIIALFRPVFVFGTSNTNTTRPWVIKTQVELNAKYFLNPERIKQTIEASSKSGHFPPNATQYSPVAHELGHYLSFIALLNHYSTSSIRVIEEQELDNYYDIIRNFGYGTFSKQMLEEAHQNYVRDNGNINFDEWRGKISGYALAKNGSGDYIYDETIAEAFHDVYLNKEKANTVSKYIVEVLKKYIEG